MWLWLCRQSHKAPTSSISMLHQNSEGENCSASHKACGAEGKEGVLQQTMHTACVSVESYVLIYFQSVGVLLLTLKEAELNQLAHFWKHFNWFWIVYLVPCSHKGRKKERKKVHPPISVFLLSDFNRIYKNNNICILAFAVILTWVFFFFKK